MNEPPIQERDRDDLPTGVVTFLLTDVESSTAAWQAEPEAMATAIGRHYEILDSVITRHGGSRPEEQGEGDSVVAAFPRASDALAAALEAQLAFGAEPWPTTNDLRVRMGVHTGEARRRNDNYVGLTIVRAARVRNLAAGGQVLLTGAARDVALDRLPAEVDLIDVGEHHLKGLTRPERLYQLAHPSLGDTPPPLTSSGDPTRNLPIDLSTFVGRANEIRALTDLLASGRLVTVAGTGGAGKTRLALQYAANAADRFSDGVRWVDLVALGDPAETGAAIVAAVGASSTEPTRHAESAAAALGDGDVLVVLDNCEHLGDEPARIATLLLGRCVNLRILTTSRRPLDVPGETVWRIPAMETPTEAQASLSTTALAEFESVQLFLQRARRARPTFALEPENAAEIAEISRRLAGIPLAIELAAARLKSMTPGQILAGLDDALRVLGHGPSILSPRHRTIEASIRWSSELLTEPERRLLDRLCVFRDSFDLVAAEAVCSGEGLDRAAILDALDGLIDQSLVRVLDDESDRRFTVLETVRQFGDAQLRDTAAIDRWRARAAAYFATVAEEAGPRCETADQFAALARLDAEHKNLVAALTWLLETGESERLVEMVLALGGYWDVGGDKLEGETWSSRALDVVGDADLVGRSRLLALRAECRHSLGNYLGAIEDGTRALELGRQAGDPLGAGRGSSTVASILSHVDLDTWRDQWETTVELLTEADDRYTLAGTLTWQAVPLLRRGFVNEGMAALVRARPHVEATGSPLLIAAQQSWEAYAQILGGDPETAETLAVAARDSGALRSHARAKGVTTIIRLARANLGQTSLDWRALVADLERSRRRGEHFAVDNDLIVTASATVRHNPFAAMEMIDQWLKDRDGLESTQHPEARVIAAHGALALGNLDEAHRRAHLALESANRVEHVLAAGRAQACLAAIELARGNTVVAEELVRESIAAHAEHGNRPALYESVAVLASIAATCGDLVESARVFGAIGPRGRTAAFSRTIAAAHHMLETQLADDERDAATEAGAAMNDAELVAYIERSHSSRGRPALGWDSLSPAERQVATLVREGLTNREIAARLFMGTETVKTHMSHIFRKLDITKRAQLAALVTEREGRG